MLDRSLSITQLAIITAGLASAATSQDATLSATLLDPLVVQTNTVGRVGSSSQTNTLPPGVLGNGSSISIASRPGFDASVAFGLATTRRSLEFSVTASGNAPRGSNSSGGSAFGTSSTNARVLLTITTTGPVSGQLEVHESHMSGGTGSEIDIGNDGSLEWSYDPFYNFPNGYPNPRIETFPITIGTSGTIDVLVRIPNSDIFPLGSLLGAQSRTSQMTIRFTPNPRCSGAIYGITCDPGIGLSVEPRLADGADIKLTGTPGGPAIALFGVARTQLTLPLPPACRLYTTIDASALFMPIMSESLVPFSLGMSGPIQFNVQAAVLDPTAGTVLTSAPLAVTCN